MIHRYNAAIANTISRRRVPPASVTMAAKCVYFSAGRCLCQHMEFAIVLLKHVNMFHDAI